MLFIELLSLAIVLFYLYMGSYSIVKDNSSPSHRTFFGIIMVFSFWVLCSIYRNLSNDPVAILLWRISSLIAWSFGSSAILHFVILVYRGNEKLRSRAAFFIYFPAALLFLVQIMSMGGYLYQRDTSIGFFMEYVVSTLFHLVFMIVSLFLLAVRAYKAETSLVRLQSRMILFSLSLTTICIVGYGFVLPMKVDFILPFILPLFTIFWISAMWIAITRLHLLEFEPAMAVYELMNNVHDLLMLTDGKGIVHEVNNVVCDKLGYKREELRALDYKTLIREEEGDFFLACSDGSYLPIRLKVTAVKDRWGHVLGQVVSALDLTLEHKYRDLSLSDGLTGIGNRMMINNVLSYEFNQAKRGNRSFSLILMDIDNFKMINDSYGHDQGDRILVSLAESIKPKLRNSDSFGRYGGEEFLVIMPGADLDAAAIAAERKYVRSLKEWGWNRG